MQTFIQFASLNEQFDHVATLRNLLALAARPGTEAEGQNARDKAEALAARHGIDLATFDKQAAPQPVQRPTPPPPDPFMKLLRQFAWHREHRPDGRMVYASDKKDLQGHYIEVSFDGSWSHMIYGNMRFGGNSVRDLFSHLQYNNG